MNRLLVAAVSVVAGAALLVASAAIDYRTSQGEWRDGFAFIGPEPDLDGLIPFVEYQPAISGQGLRRSMHRILFIDFDDADWHSILAEGAIPDPAKHEALAGVLCSDDEIDVDGETYRVTGRLHRTAGGLSTAYLIPLNGRTFDPANEDKPLGIGNSRTREGFYDRDAQRRTSESDFEWPEDVEPLFVHDAVPMAAGLPYAVIAGLALTLYGAAVLQWRLVLWLHRVSGAFNGLVTASREHPSLFRFVHTLNYSAFFYVMLAGTMSPLANLAASQWVFEMFSEGALKELGQAYLDGNVLLAAWATFHNNFIVQTVLLAALPSLVIPLFGVGKTLVSLVVVGFAMAPVWSGSTDAMTFHWITITLEIQAYIIVSFGICVYTLEAGRALFTLIGGLDGEEPSTSQGFRFGFETLVSATMYACLALAVAAMYEAVTLIAMGASIMG